MPRAKQSKAVRVVAMGVLLSSGFGLAAKRLQGAQEAGGDGAETKPTITVRIYNYPHVSQERIGRASQVAARILHAAGIKTKWVDCKGPNGEVTGNAECARNDGPATMTLKIVTQEMARRYGFGLGVLGFAPMTERAKNPTEAYVFYELVEDICEREPVEPHMLLGIAAAHEIGHLLLGSNSHSASGLMRARWDGRDLALARVGQFGFTREQAVAVFAAACGRAANQRVETASIE